MVKFQDSLCSPPPSGHKRSLLSSLGSKRRQRQSHGAQQRAACRQGFIFTATVAILSLALSYFLYQMLSVHCAALMKRARTILVCLKEGRDGLISMASDGDSGFVGFPAWNTSNIFPHFSSLRTEWDAAAVLMNTSTKSLTVNLFFLYLCLSFCTCMTVLLSPLPSVLHKG